MGYAINPRLGRVVGRIGEAPQTQDDDEAGFLQAKAGVQRSFRFFIRLNRIERGLPPVELAEDSATDGEVECP